MLKNFFRVALLAVAAVCALASCVDNTADYDALRPTLLGGVYFYSDHDGVAAFDAQIKSEALSSLKAIRNTLSTPIKVKASTLSSRCCAKIGASPIA